MGTKTTPILQLHGITKHFSSVVANDSVDLEICPGEIHVLLGENGAGKSTLMKIVHGMYQPDAGDIYWKAKKVKFSSPMDAISNHIGMIYQDFRLIEKLSVNQNIVLGFHQQKNIFINERKTAHYIQKVSDKFGLSVDPKAIIRDLPAGEKQRVEIIKVLLLNPDLIIMDEPTSMLTPQEVEFFFDTIRSLVKDGKAVCFITHKLDEVMKIGTRITVLRDGRVVGTVLRKETNPKELAKMMVGRDVLFRVKKEERKPGKKALIVENIIVKGNTEQSMLKGVSLSVHEGEILGVAGISGNGQIELAESIAGLRSIDKGKIVISGQESTKSTPLEVIEMGCSYIPDNVRKNAVFMDLNLNHNAIIKSQNSPPIAIKGILNYQEAVKFTNSLLKTYNIKAPHQYIIAKQLSGGNLQKLILAREFMLKPKVIVGVNLTAGVDVSAIEYIHTKILEQRQKGCAILLISADLGELLNLCDRIIVLCSGRVTGVVDPWNTNQEEIGLMMGGSHPEDCVVDETEL